MRRSTAGTTSSPSWPSRSPRAPLLCVTGGLGPTEDDRTKEAVAALLGRKLVRDEEILERLRERFRKRGREMPEVNAKQADVIEGAVVLPNRRGTAPGYLVEDGREDDRPPSRRAVGDEGDFRRERSAAPDGGGTPPGVHRRVLKVVGLGESAVEELVRPVYEAHRGHDVTILAAAPGEVQLHFAARGTLEEAREGARRPGGRLPVGGRPGPLRTGRRDARRGRRSAPEGRRPDARGRGVVHRGNGGLADHRRRRVLRVLSRRCRYLRERGEDRRSSASRPRPWRRTERSRRKSPGRWPPGCGFAWAPRRGSGSPASRGPEAEHPTSRSAPSTSPSTSRTGPGGTSGSSFRATALWCAAGRRPPRWG